MKLQRIAILGGGPGGLFAGRLLKLRHPDAQVDVYEQNAPDRTFGFGVGLPAGAQRNLRAADSPTVDAVERAGTRHDAAMRLGSRSVRFADFSTIAIARTELLRVLRIQAESVGVSVHFGHRASINDLDAEVIIAADGVNSATRDRFSAEFDPQVDISAGLYLWAGTEFALEHAVFAPAHTTEGTFVTHAYPYAKHASTFLIETDETTWRKAGFSDAAQFTDPAASDEESLRYLGSAFAEVLGGRPLVGNRTRWLRFRTVRCRRWHHRNIVLLGDAAHTAHYSIGSGTKLAMEDAIELDRALAEANSVPEAFEAYEARRQPAVVELQAIARRSELWWETFPDHTELPIEQLMIAYMTRAGKVPLQRFLDTTPDIVRRGLADYAGIDADEVPTTGIASWVLDRPLDRAGFSMPTRLFTTAVDSERTDRSCAIDGRSMPDPGTIPAAIIDIPSDMLWSGERLDTAAGATDTNRPVLWLRGSAARSDVLDRFAIADDLRRRSARIVAVDVPADLLDDAAAALAGDRIDVAVQTRQDRDEVMIAHRLRR
ncbi:FAD-dependent monooxygenase [Nocardia sp. NPDC059239]|uniref:FAD-dependent monooxygenase n=1 Tax=unclassified Nocardia TaxID=2637762 RepID=UPI003680D4CE